MSVLKSQLSIAKSDQRPQSSQKSRNWPQPKDYALNIVIQTLNKNPEARTQVDLLNLLPIVRVIPFFGQIGVSGKGLNEICELVQHDYGLKEQVLIDYGSSGDRLFYVLEGHLDLYIDFEGPLLSDKNLKVLDKDLSSSNIGQEYQRIYNIENPKGQLKMGEYNIGDCFGLVSAIKERSYQRHYRLVCTQDCHFAVFTKVSYEKILDWRQKRQLQEEINFFKGIDYFHNVNKRVISKLLNVAQLQKLKRGQCLFKEGDTPQYVYIVKQGELEVRKNIYEKKTNNEEYQLLTNTTVTKKFNNNFSRLQGRRVVQQVALNLLGPGTMVGGEEVIGSLSHTNSAIVHSMECRALVISTEDFRQIFTQQEDSYQQLKADQKDKQHEFAQNWLKRVNTTNKVRQKLNGESNIKVMCDTLMREMLWSQVPQAAKLYDSQKQEKSKLQSEAQLMKKAVFETKKTFFENRGKSNDYPGSVASIRSSVDRQSLMGTKKTIEINFSKLQLKNSALNSSLQTKRNSRAKYVGTLLNQTTSLNNTKDSLAKGSIMRPNQVSTYGEDTLKLTDLKSDAPSLQYKGVACTLGLKRKTKTARQSVIQDGLNKSAKISVSSNRRGSIVPRHSRNKSIVKGSGHFMNY